MKNLIKKSAMPNASKLFVFILMLLAGNNLKAANYYWVGGTGNWSDFANHWATTSGGSTFHVQPPTPLDDVYFDANSFMGTSDTLYFSAANFCKNLTANNFSNVVVLNFINNTNKLSCYGSMELDSLMQFATGDKGIIEFASLNTGNQITFNGVRFEGNRINFNSSGGWMLSDDLIMDSLTTGSPGEIYVSGLLIAPNIKIVTSRLDLIGVGTIGSDFSGSNIFSSLYLYLSANINYSNSFLHSAYTLGRADFNYLETKNYVMTQSHGNLLIANSLDGIIGDSIQLLKMPLDSGVTATITPFSPFTPSHFTKAEISGSLNTSASSTAGFIAFDTLFFTGPNSDWNAGDSIFINNLLVSNVTTPNHIFIHDGKINSNNPVCLNNIWLQNVDALGAGTFNAGTGSIDLGGNTGWQFAPCTIVSNVWPGDANYDLTVNNNDVLNIGLAYSETGPVRSGASLVYVAQPATDWSNYFQTAVNHKHADTNGDGIVDANDTTAISLNYGINHPARYAQGANQNATGAPLYLIATPDSAVLSDTVYVEAWLGTSQFPVDSIYGIAFSISYDTALVDTNWFSFDFPPSWFGTQGVDELAFVKNIPLEGRMDFALTRTDHNNASGFGGPLTRTGIVIVDNVAGRMPLPFTLSNAYALTASEFELLISTLGDTVSVDTTALTGINYLQQTTIHAYPNPFGNFLLPQKVNEQSNLQLINEMGQVILSQTLYPNEKKIIDTKNLRKGIYILNVFNSKINSRVKMVKL